MKLLTGSLTVESICQKVIKGKSFLSFKFYEGVAIKYKKYSGRINNGAKG
jgi:hypothetical protein